MRKLFFYTVDEQYKPVPLLTTPSAENDPYSRWQGLADKIAALAQDCGFERADQDQPNDSEAFSPAVIVLLLPAAALGQSAFFDQLPGPGIRPLHPHKDGGKEEDMRYQPVVTVAMPDIMDFYSETQHRERRDEDGKKYFFDLSLDARFKFLDSSIWHRYVPLSPRKRSETFGGMLREVLNEMGRHWDDGLYRTNAAIATLEFQLRMLQHSYIAKTGIGGHAVAVKPFKFHSETWMKRKAAEEIEFFTDPEWEGGDLIGQLRWRALIVDDYAERVISCVEGSTCTLNKTTLILRPVRQLYEAKLKKENGKTDVSPEAVVKMQGEQFEAEPAEVTAVQERLGMLTDAQGKLRSTAYDIIFLDYLLDDHGGGQREYGHELMLELLRNDIEAGAGESEPFRREYMGRYWVFPISSFPFAFPDKLNQLGISHLHDIWHLSSGGDPIAAPHLYAYYLYRFMKQKVAQYFLYPEALRRFLNEVPVDERSREFWARFLRKAVSIRRSQDRLLKQKFGSASSPFIESMRGFLRSQKKLKGLLVSIKEILDFFSADFPPLLRVFEQKCEALAAIHPKYGPVLKPFTNKVKRLARREYQEALNEINLDRKVTDLSLMGKNLTELPPEIGEMLNLEQLDISQNRLTDFPTELFKLKNLREINLRGNKIQWIPAAGFEGMSRLRRLDLTGNTFIGKVIEAKKGETFAAAFQKSLSAVSDKALEAEKKETFAATSPKALPATIPISHSDRRIFISYAHEDCDSKNRLHKKLQTYEFDCVFTVWQDGQIRPGEFWEPIIEEQLMTARIIIFLVSDAMINSKYIREVELKAAMERQKEPVDSRPHIVPIVLKKCHWERDFAAIQHATRRPIDSYGSRNNGWDEAATSITRLLK